MCQGPALCVVPQLCVSGSSFCVLTPALCVRSQLCVSGPSFVCQFMALCVRLQLLCVNPQLAACQAPACSMSGPILQRETGMFNASGPHSVHQTCMFHASDPLCVRQEYLMCQIPASNQHVHVSRWKLSTFIRSTECVFPEIQKLRTFVLSQRRLVNRTF